MTEQPLFMDETIPVKRPEFVPATLAVGDTVLVAETSMYRRNGAAPVIHTATVIAKARVWITAKLDYQHGREIRFRLDTQRDNNKGHYGFRFRTHEQHRWEEADAASYTYRASQGIRIDHDSPWHGRSIALARIIWKGINDAS